MAGEWREMTVGEIAAPMRNALVGGPFGSNLVSRDYVDAGVPVIRGQNMGGRWVAGEFAYVTDAKADSLDANLARPGDIVFTQRGTLGQVSIVPSAAFDRYLVSQSQMKLTVNPDVADPLFIYYVFSSAEQQDYIRQHAIQTGVPHTNLGILRGTLLPLPPLPEQRAIAHILGRLDDKIELNRRINETLEAMARALFKSWFVDFDPVSAKAERRDPGLPQPLADLFPNSFVDSELGEIPRGWEVGRLSDLAKIDKGLSYKGEGLTDQDGMPMVNLGCFAGGGLFKPESIKRYRGDYKDRHVVGVGDLVIANTDVTQSRIILGSPALVPEMNSEQRFLFTHHMFAFRFKAGQERWRRYLYFVLLQPGFREIAEGYATGTTVLALPMDGLLNHSLVLPPEEILNAFERHVAQTLEPVEIRRKQSRTLANLRDTLLPKLISGELRARNTDYIAEFD